MRKASEEKALHVQDVLGPGYTVLEFEETTATSEQAAAAIGCTVAQIAKSVLFKTKEGDPVLVVASGPNRVDDKKIRDNIFVNESDAGQPSNRTKPDRGVNNYLRPWYNITVTAGGEVNATPWDIEDRAGGDGGGD